jgi:flavodoxin I
MKTLVIFDSLYGNTELVARAIAGGITGEVEVRRVTEVDLPGLKGFDLLVVGSPTQGGRATQVMRDFLKKIPDSSLKDINVTAFDTRLTNKLVTVFGYAAGRIAASLKEKGANQVISPEGFFVKGTKGPVKEGELERAAGWLKESASK